MAKTTKQNSLFVTQTKSKAGREKSLLLSLRALGLGRIGKKVQVEDNGCIRGLIRKVSHLVRVEESNG
ncbi:MAG: 50S ribosomal protein L30 [Holosporaceae bacterium]|jgi:large subunit ribosomal protein L30|nr:50S ribosomal protein L30 [Holosporaceae bacterium]